MGRYKEKGERKGILQIEYDKKNRKLRKNEIKDRIKKRRTHTPQHAPQCFFKFLVCMGILELDTEQVHLALFEVLLQVLF